MPYPDFDRTKHLLTVADHPKEQVFRWIDRGIELKKMRLEGIEHRPLVGKTLAMIFEKASTRTRVSFEAGMHQLGGHALFLSPKDTQLGRGEPIEDTARVLCRMVAGIMIRTFEQETVERMAAYSSVPVINGLTDFAHPCQILADLMTLKERFGHIDDLVVSWVGDGNNMAHSWIFAAAHLGFTLRLATPEGFEPQAEVMAWGQERNPSILLTRDPLEAVAGAHAVTTDVWASMGQEDEEEERAKIFELYQVDEEVMEHAGSDAVFLHCLPAYRGDEVAAAVIDGPQSLVWDEAENRLHVQKAVLEDLMGGNR